MTGFLIFLILSCVVAIGDIMVAFFAFRKHSDAGKYLGFAALSAAVVDVGYLIASHAQYKVVFSLFSSIEFCAMDYMLFTLLMCVFVYVGWDKKAWVNRFRPIILMLCLMETCIFIVNVFYPISVDYVRLPSADFPLFSYDMGVLYWVHLLFTYFLVVIVVGTLALHIISLPGEYRFGFGFVIGAIGVIVLINALFLFLPVEERGRLDYSVLAYVIGFLALYWSMFIYNINGMTKKFKNYAFNAVEQGVVLFDFKNRLILKNDRALKLMPWLSEYQEMTQELFLEKIGMELPGDGSGEKESFRCYVPSYNGIRPMRCDYSVMRNEKGLRLGSLFAFSDEMKKTDLLTGFLRWKKFQKLGDNPGERMFSVVSVCDINGLEQINRKLGSDAGDQAIQKLSAELRNAFPDGTLFVRGPEAALLAVNQGMTIKTAKGLMEKLRSRCGQVIQYSVQAVFDNDIVKAATLAIHAMQVRKMLDVSSQRSETLSSLVRALEQSDFDTENHVLRTQVMGEALAERFEMSDAERAELSLLCVLHDIGKIGVPLEILNKPGRLSESEMEAIRAHVHKGYHIALSSPDTACIADAVLHHHERWDGNGYPDRLSGKSIPLLSRMIAVVDAYDAMVSNRSYRPAMRWEDALKELERCSGTQFDPVIAGEFIRMIREDPEKYARDEVSLHENIETEGDSEKQHEQHVKNTGSRPILCCRYWMDDSMNIVRVDDAFENVTGYSKQDVLEKKLSQRDLLPAEDLAGYLLVVNEQLSHRPFAYVEHRLRRKDGSVLYALCYGRDYYDSVEKGYRTEIMLADCASIHSVQLLCGGSGVRQRPVAEESKSAPRSTSDRGEFLSSCGELLQKNDRVLLLALGFPEGAGRLSERAEQLIDAMLNVSLRGSDLTMWDGNAFFSAAFGFGEDVGEESIRERVRMLFDRINLRLQVAGETLGISMVAAISQAGEQPVEILERCEKRLLRAVVTGKSLFLFD